MGQPFVLSPAARNFSLASLDGMSAHDVVHHFAVVRWGSFVKPICPSCGLKDQHYFINTRRVWRCRELSCGRQFSVTSETPFADHKLPLKQILRAIVLYQAAESVMTAAGLQRALGVAYQTAFVLLHKLR